MILYNGDKKMLNTVHKKLCGSCVFFCK